MNQAVLIIGGNVGDRLANLKKTISLLKVEGAEISLVSSVFKTEPWGYISESWFYNMVLKVDIRLELKSFFTILQGIEKEMGRLEKTTEGYADRIIDIDILFFNEVIIQEDNLQVPHPRLHLRKFVLEPLKEVLPDLIHPVLKKSIRELSEECEDSSVVIKIGDL